MATIPTQNFPLQQGDTDGFAFACKTTASDGTLVNRFDLTGAVVRMQARTAYGAPNTILDVSSAATSGDRIVLDIENCHVSVELTAATMSAVKAGKYVYDVECTLADSTVERLVKGTLTVTPAVTV